MTGTKRAYNDPRFCGSPQMAHPWKQTTNRNRIGHKEDGVPKQVMSKRRRLEYASEVERYEQADIGDPC